MFLDYLAEAMIDSGLARPASVKAAGKVLSANPKNPLIMSKLPGRYLEIWICTSTQDTGQLRLLERRAAGHLLLDSKGMG